ncbi:hypothetical protein J7E24_06350 [Hymenobacter sp. ISL-91]|uniref:hypothetical protein n=1 Tax=Hymenobacter sp. ISL-91 TaxID=2819151 RepID=UPI001BE6C6E3|nr:hypothetical protein [Hymenobacter sp. ISL-91]MBT2557399.1 hypothetical protein [Hymenobacter sp. ISL-91]
MGAAAQLLAVELAQFIIDVPRQHLRYAQQPPGVVLAALLAHEKYQDITKSLYVKRV